MPTTHAFNPVTLLREQASTVTRYNGGWVKRVDGLDKTVATGYSILGPFMRDGADVYVEGGLYLDCSIGGSRRNQEKTYHLFRVVAGPDVELLSTVRGRDWAVALWPHIDAALAAPEPKPLAQRILDEIAATGDDTLDKLDVLSWIESECERELVGLDNSQ